MCGIFCIINQNGDDKDCLSKFNKCRCLLTSRGPDMIGTLKVKLSDSISAFFGGMVLWTQGDDVCKQPLTDSMGNVLLWNGDIFSGFDMDSKSDTEILLEHFVCLGVEKTLCRVEGPYSFVYYNKDFNCVWFGRDPLGRISFLWSYSTSTIVLTSVSPPSLDVDELPPLGLYLFNVNTSELTVKPWIHQHEINYTLPNVIKFAEPIEYKVISSVCNKFNTSFKPDVNDLIYLEVFNDVNGNIGLFYDKLVDDHTQLQNCVETLFNCLSGAVKRRCHVCPPFCRDCKPERRFNCCHTKVGILFSGGLDSTILALLADKCIPNDEAIDLFNVAFEKPSSAGPFNAPDRITGQSSLSEIKLLAPNRTWNFIEIDVMREELESKRDLHINELIYPRDSILDEDLGCALWFAASGKGTLNGIPYTSPATVLLLGMGADEMFGGYRKARRAWLDKGWDGLSNELVNGLINLPNRNLGRDNRVVSDHSRVPRFPFLDENVVSFAYSLLPWNKCYLGRELPEGVGDKILLRLLAWKLGLKKTSTLPKRALQFGSRIANSKEIGNDISKKLHKSWILRNT